MPTGQSTVDLPLGLTADRALALFDAQLGSRHLDLAARALGKRGEGFYSIGSSGHEGNAAVAAALRVTDPALLHYRSGAFYLARAAQHRGSTPLRDVLRGITASAAEPISGGRHKVFGHRALSVIPQTSTIASHLPRAVGVAFGIERAKKLGLPTEWPPDAVVVCTFGDASANHSTATGAINTATHCAYQNLPLPILFVCEDNGIGISVRTPKDWIRAAYGNRPGLRYFDADGTSLPEAAQAAAEAVTWVRTRRAPAFLRLRTIRLMGHAGSDVESAYRTQAEITADHARDPLLRTALLLAEHGILTPAQIHTRYESKRTEVATLAAEAIAEPKLTSAAEVLAPLTTAPPLPAPTPSTPPPATSASSAPRPTEPLPPATGPATAPAPATGPATPPPPAAGSATPPPATTGSTALPSAAAGSAAPLASAPRPLPPSTRVTTEPLTLAQSINQALADLLTQDPATLIFGEDVATKGGVYGVTRGLRKAFGAARVFDTLLDEQTILGTALGTALTGFLPIPEIQYLAYLHNAADQLRGEAATLRFFANNQYRNPMIVRIAGLAYQKGFGGHFHNDNSLTALRDIPGLAIAVPAHPADAAPLLRACATTARHHGTVSIYLEPIALYHTRDLHTPGDNAWLAPYPGAAMSESRRPGTALAESPHLGSALAQSRRLGTALAESPHPGPALAEYPRPGAATSESPRPGAAVAEFGRARTHGDGTDLTIITFGNGVPMSLRVARRLGLSCRVVDLRWLAPLPVADILREASVTGRVLIADETRRTGGVSEAVITALTDHGFQGRIRRVTSADSFIPLGPAASHVLLSEPDIAAAAQELLA
ncbi:MULTISPECIES: thiamine pyrophosphate-dependent enzyme [unclassified Crossiella]|uniref:thiamine pyrophosphate-dependent enzyme n=1 Tax=unclassified Crossiella TaxID=2620835 RepID=UPI001FFFF18F|nr:MULTISPECIES: thiamine pyrophosphate-dependent enzyme [unclassified Crossiella]MCK2242776.1 thiamine pyrophosphate-dependent enzyme [Crossiella sp. S99.2]MCK2256653.1 thiamine pyrophosphate-dependent enzyme [Crossiella sp. S99.1]